MKQRFRSWLVAATVMLLAPLVASAAKVAVTISPVAAKKAYDGTPLKAIEVEASFAKGATWVNPGDHAVADFADELTDVRYTDKGEVTSIQSRLVTGTVKILNVQGNDVSDDYTITLGTSTLTVTPRPITVTVPSTTNEYAGVSLTNENCVVTTTGGAAWDFPANDGIVEPQYTGSLTKVGEVVSAAKLVFVTRPAAEANYEITTVPGKLVVVPYSVAFTNIYTSGDVKYQGRTNDLGVVDVTTSSFYPKCELQPGDKVEYTCLWVREKDAACYDRTTKSNLSCRIVNAANEDVTSCYGAFAWDVAAGENVDINITRRSVTMTSASAEKVYDGTPLTTNEVTVTGDGFVAGEYATYNVKGSQIQVGSSPNDFSYTLKNGALESNYNIGCNNGTLTVLPLPPKITIVADSVTNEYNGAGLTGGYKVYTNGVLCVDGLLEGGRRVVATTAGSATNTTDVGVNAIDTFAVYEGVTEVTAQYEITPVNGEIKITPRPITVKFFDVESVYDGHQHYPSNAVVVGTLVPGHGIDTDWTCSPLDAGTYDCTNTAVMVGTQQGYLTENYDITRANTNALSVITKRPVTLTSATAEKFYDGTELSSNKWSDVTEGMKDAGMVSGEEFNIADWASLTYVGRTNNTFVVTDSYTANTNNYDITYNFGTLTVKGYRIAYDLGGGDFTNGVDEIMWNFPQYLVKGASNNFTLYTPVRAGYVFKGWTNAVAGTELIPAGDFGAEAVEMLQLTAVWEKLPVPTTIPFADTTDRMAAAWRNPDEAPLSVELREALVENMELKNDPNGAYTVTAKIKIPENLNSKELQEAIRYSVDSTNKFACTDDVSCVTAPYQEGKWWYVNWTATIYRGQLSEALANGADYAETKLYCSWTDLADDKCNSIFTIKFDPDTVTLFDRESGTVAFPWTGSLRFLKGYDVTNTVSQVNADQWAAVEALAKDFTNTVDLLENDVTKDLVRTGYTFKGWSPATTRGALPMTKDAVLEQFEVAVVALWETNTYKAELKTVPGTEIDYTGFETLTNDWTVESLDIELPVNVTVTNYDFLGWTNAKGEEVGSITIDELGTNGLKTVVFTAIQPEHVYNISFNLTNDFANIDREGTPYIASANNYAVYTVSSNGGAFVTLNDASCFGCKFVGWKNDGTGTFTNGYTAAEGGDQAFTAVWTEYQAMVVENDAGVTNYFTSVAEAVAAVTNSNTTIAFLDAKGDGIQGACPIVIQDNLKGIEINFCALDYTNEASVAALTIGAGAEVAVKSHPMAVGYSEDAVARLVQVGGGNAVKVGENAKFTLDDDKIVLDVLADSESEVVKAAKAARDEAAFVVNEAHYTAVTNGPNGVYLGQGLTKAVAQIRDWNDVILWTNDQECYKYSGVVVCSNEYAETLFASFTNLTDVIAFETKWTNQLAVASAAAKAFGPAIYAENTATLVLNAGTIGAKAYGETNNCASIEWVGHSEYLGSADLFFATKPVQESVEDGKSQIAAGYIWTTNGVEDAEFPYAIAKLGSVAFEPNIKKIESSIDGMFGIRTCFPKSFTEAYNHIAEIYSAWGISNNVAWWSDDAAFAQTNSVKGDVAMATFDAWKDGLFAVAPGGTILSTNVTVKGTFATMATEPGQSAQMRGHTMSVYVPTGVNATNDVVVRPTSGTMTALKDSEVPASWRISYKALFGEYESMLVKTLEQNAPTNLTFQMDWDGAAGVSNDYEYIVAFDAKNITITNAEGNVLFPYQGKITYDARLNEEGDNLIATNDLVSSYNIFDTITNANGIVLAPAAGINTNGYRFVGWTLDGELTNSINHVTGAGQDVKDITLVAKFEPLCWATNELAGAQFVSAQEAIDALPAAGGLVKYLGAKNISVEEALSIDGSKVENLTIDFGGKSVTNATDDIAFLVEVKDAIATITNVTFKSNSEKVGGIRVSGASEVTLANSSVVFTTLGTMLQAEEGAYVEANGTRFEGDGEQAVVKAFGDDTTLVCSNLSYGSQMIVSNNAALALYGVNFHQVPGSAIRAQDGALVELGAGTYVGREVMDTAIVLENSKLVVDGAEINNSVGGAIYSTAFEGEDDFAEVELKKGKITANGIAVAIHAGKFTAVEGQDGIEVRSAVAAIRLDNDLGLLKAENIVIRSGLYGVNHGELYTDPVAIDSVDSSAKAGEEGDYLTGFLDYATLTDANGEILRQGALFETPIALELFKKGYECCTKDQRVESGYNFWYFAKTIAYEITYDLQEGTRTSGEEVWPTSYNVEDDVINLPSNTVTKANYVFGAWSISNKVTDVVTTNMVIVPGVDFGDLALTALWQEKPNRVYVDYQGEDGYPKYRYLFDVLSATWYWSPSTRYPYWNYATGKDAGVVVSPSKTVTLTKPEYKGYEFLYFENVANGRKYYADKEYGVLDFEFENCEVGLRAVWASDMGIMDDQGNRYNTLEDAIASTNTLAGATLRIIGGGSQFSIGKTVVIDKNITLDLNGKTLVMGEGFADDTLVVITNAPEAVVMGGTILNAGETNSIAVIDAEAKAEKAIDSSWLLTFGTELSADYIVDGYVCAKAEDESGLYEIVAKTHTLAFASEATGADDRADLVMVTNNVGCTFTCDDTEVIALADATREGYTFLGWFDGDTKVTGFFDPNGVTRDVTLVAKWQANEYEIAFELDDGFLPSEAKTTYTCETYAFELAEPLRANYTFTGWRLDGAEPVTPCAVDPRAKTDFSTVFSAVAVWAANCYTITFDTVGGSAISPLKYNEEMMNLGYVTIPAAEKAGSKFTKWVDAQGNEVAVGLVTSCYSADLTAVWTKSLWSGDNTVVGGNPSDTRGTAFSGNVTYTGYLMKDGIVCGKVAVTAGKPNASTGKATVTMTVSQELGTGKSYTLKNTAVVVTGEVLENVVLSGGTTAAPLSATLDAISNNGLTGTFGGYAITASADRFATNVTKIPAGALAYLQGNWTGAFACRCEDGKHGATTYRLTVAAKGKVTVAGNLPDGTAFSTTAQLVYGDGVCVCPVVVNAYSGKKGGFSFLVWFGSKGAGDNLVDDVEITDVSPIFDKNGDEECTVVGMKLARLADFTAEAQPDTCTFKVDLAQLWAELPEGYVAVTNQITDVRVSHNGSKIVVPTASKVTIDKSTGDVTFDGDNDLGLALSVTTSTGAITGSFKVYAKVQGTNGNWTLKTYTAKVYGVAGVNDGLVGGAGTCVQATLGNTPFALQPDVE